MNREEKISKACEMRLEYKSVTEIADTLNISTSTANKWVKHLGIKLKPLACIEKPIEYYLVKNPDGKRKTNNPYLKRKLIKKKIFEAKCNFCGLDKWLGDPILLDLHHKNQDGSDNRLENLELLCPNCHASQHRAGNNGL